MRTFVLLSALFASTPAFALSCLDWDVTGALPADGAADVPENAQIAVRVYSWDVNLAPPVLRDAAGNEVAATVQTFAGGSETTFVLVPDETLTPGATYTAFVAHGWEDADFAATSFTVGEGSDTTAPSAPEILDVSSERDNDEWGTWSSLTIEHTESTDDSGAVLYQARISENEDMSEPLIRHLFSPGERLSDNPCTSDAAGALRAGDVWVELDAIDVAGNVSDGAEPPVSGGCSSLGGAPVGLLALAPVLLGLRRRRS